METKDFTLTFSGAGTDKKTLGAGMSFVVLSSSSAMTGKVYRKGMQIAEISLISQGDMYTAVAPFDYVELNSAGAQTVVVLLTEGHFKTGELTGSVSISNAPNIGTVAAVTPDTLVASTFYRGSISAALDTIVTPAANTTGLLVQYASATSINNGTLIRISAKTSAPASVTDTSARTILGGYNASSVQATWVRDRPVIIPAGYGLYAQSNDAVGNSGVLVAYGAL